MKPSDLRLKAIFDVVKHEGIAYRIMRTARPLEGWLVQQHSGWPFFGCLDRPSLRDLTVAWAFAARSPRTITYLPVRSSDSFASLPHGLPVPNLDLVLVHHSLQFSASQWKPVRARLTRGHDETVALSESAYDVSGMGDLTLYKESRDRLVHRVAADTLILTGSRRAFARELEAMCTLAVSCSSEQSVDSHGNPYAEIVGDLLYLSVRV